MIKVTNGELTVETTNGAYNGVLKSLGYWPVEEQKQVVEDNSNEDDSEQFVNDLLEKPISEWNKDELKRFTEIKQIDTSKAKNVAAVKEIIKQWLDENE